MPQYYIYWIVFHGEYENELPIFYYNDLIKLKKYTKDTMHLFDDNLISVISAVEFVMHLPRFELDLYNLHEQEIDLLYDIPHQIVLVPDSILIKMRDEELLKKPTLVIYSEDCDFANNSLAKLIPSELGYFETQKLSEDRLINIWESLSEMSCLENHEKLANIEKQYLVRDEYLKVLPLLFFARQYDNIDSTFAQIYNSTDIDRRCMELQFNYQIHQNTLVALRKNGITDFNGAMIEYEAYRLKESRKDAIALVLTIPGVPKVQVKYGGVQNVLPDIEKAVIRSMGIHRAIAQNGILVEMPCVGQDIFKIINDIELYCYDANNKYVWKTLRKLGERVKQFLGEDVKNCILNSKHVSIFSDIPIGLAILEGTDVPIHCHKSVSYHPLTPLTRNYQSELMMNEKYYMGNGCKIAFAECILKEDTDIRKTSEQIKESLQKMKQQYPSVELVYRETLTINELKQFINDNCDADILYISAHGHYERKSNVAGLMVGNEFWMAETNDFRVPPIVLLSACHVSPRGSGVVSVADMFMRAGAKAVLGTLIPVNAMRNTILMNRLFVYIMESQNGNKQYNNLAEAWAGITSSNAIHEMMLGSPGFSNWMLENNKDGISRLVDFQTKRCVGRLRSANIYSDTIRIVKAMLKEEGMEGKFADVLDQENIYPESFFYQFIGYPENIILSIEE